MRPAAEAIKVNRMPNRRLPSPREPAPPKRGTFRQRYDDLETQRTALMQRLSGMSANAQQHPAYKRSLTLLNDTFRRAKLAQRLAVLQAAAWLIDVLEQITTML